MLSSKSTHLAPTLALGAAVGALLTLPAQRADACGCFAPPDPSVPVVQAGEQIVFSHQDGKVTAHIQIQYQGEANEFGWILPLPSVPDLKLGTDELFAQLIATTQPKYRLNRVFDDQCALPPLAAGSTNDGRNEGNQNTDPDVVVLQDSIGPYDYAVLRGDSRDEMFEWLTENRYFIPGGTEDVVGPYIHTGAYFLALKLRKGNDAGDIQPVVLSYESDLPMIPIILTQVAANPNMGIRVWVLGEYRAIPRNYRHTVLNDEYIDWFNAGQNYNDVIVAATNEAPDGQSFVTEFAGAVDRMQNLLDYDGRFGVRSELERITEPGLYVQYLRSAGFPWSANFISTLKQHIPFPAGLAGVVSEEEFYNNADYYLTYYREENPRQFEGYDVTLDAAEITGQLWDRIVVPTQEAGRLFRENKKMTRLYTTLSPEEMTKDPTFSFNPSLPDVDNEHNATFTQICDSNGSTNGSGILELPDGRRFYVENAQAWQEKDRTGVPYSRRIELLREEGAPQVEVDNSTRISDGDVGDGGCACSARTESGAGLANPLALAGLLGLGLLARRRR
jgi:MYXO-CTERM domain-containing protein